MHLTNGEKGCILQYDEKHTAGHGDRHALQRIRCGQELPENVQDARSNGRVGQLGSGNQPLPH